MLFRSVDLTLPGFLSEKLGRETLPILLPGFFFFKFVPFYAKLRAMMRFGIFALLFVAAGAGFALTGIDICKGWFLHPNTYDCGSFVVN